MVFRRINFGLFAWYLARCWHMIGSAFQIRHGYPQFTVGRALKKSNPISWCIYMAFFLAPPLFEISVLIDWTFSETSLGLFDFYNVEVIDYRLYLIYGIRKLEVFYARDRGSKVHPVAKALLGGGILFGICSVVVMALTLLSETTYGSTYKPRKMDVSIRFENMPASFRCFSQINHYCLCFSCY
ncbi:hypothetical protein AB6A40_011438 [Gnathostoma spinigerum]|uniref:Piezo THU9 and anchor domain-containing protein n=1 Tax=Gnathostoma spinigerum TaxID=75299 RepID=A0ABD6F1R7_9BILA